jgi:hypothetical protein
MNEFYDIGPTLSDPNIRQVVGHIDTPEQAIAVTEAYRRRYNAGLVVVRFLLDTTELDRQLDQVRRALSRLRYPPKQPASGGTGRAKRRRFLAGIDPRKRR